ncbi:MAG: O-antigen ligase family protein [Candidatus Dadabacteria bacterium]|nr:MAG: O-antigen ligase family protein [Candidatus Dadabacteria bacterium]
MRTAAKPGSAKPLIVVIVVASLIGIGILVTSERFNEHVLLLVALGLPAALLVLRAFYVSSFRFRVLISQLRWWHMLWLLMLLSGLVFRIRDTETIQQNPIDSWALYRMGLMAVIGAVLVVRLAMKKTDWLSSLLGGSLGLLTGYAVVAIISSLWSLYPAWTLYKSLEYLIDLALIAAILASVRSLSDMKSLFDWTWLLVALLAASAWAGALLWPDLGLRHDVGLLGVQLAGAIPAMETNHVGELGAILGIVALNRFLFSRDKAFYIVLFIAAMVTLVFAQSRSPITGFLVAVPLMLFAARRIGPIALTAILLFAALTLTSFTDIFWEFFLRGQNEVQFSSLSGRTEGWVLGWELFKRSPLLGFGAYAGGRFAVLTELGRNLSASEWSSVLNTWLEIMIGVGLLGLVFVAAAFIRTWVNLLSSAFSSPTASLTHCLAVESIGILALISVRSMFTTEIFWHPPLTFFLVMGYGEFLYRLHKYSRRREAVFAARTSPTV